MWCDAQRVPTTFIEHPRGLPENQVRHIVDEKHVRLPRPEHRVVAAGVREREAPRRMAGGQQPRLPVEPPAAVVDGDQQGGGRGTAVASDAELKRVRKPGSERPGLRLVVDNARHSVRPRVLSTTRRKQPS
jgi:hypothetical protein